MFFYDTENASVHNFQDVSTWSCFAKTVKELINVMQCNMNLFKASKKVIFLQISLVPSFKEARRNRGI